VSLFAISTFDTDYLLVKNTTLDKARQALQARGYKFRKLHKKTEENKI
jgi:hypothetical protein